MMILLITCVGIGVSGCAGTVPVVAPPPLPAKPALTSAVQDANDRTGEVGVWLSYQDVRRLVRYMEDVETVKDKWR